MQTQEASPHKNTYMLLSRLQGDCDYFLGHGNRDTSTLWACEVPAQIAQMRELWNSLPADGKPEWLTWEQIDAYEAQMLEEPTK